jgi:hypothetical protein
MWCVFLSGLDHEKFSRGRSLRECKLLSRKKKEAWELAKVSWARNQSASYWSKARVVLLEAISRRRRDLVG